MYLRFHAIYNAVALSHSGKRKNHMNAHYENDEVILIE